jgi:hypothetical protein
VVVQPKPLPVTPKPVVVQPKPLPVTPKPVVVQPKTPSIVIKREPPLDEVWTFVLTQLENNERDNMKLRRAMRLAFDMGVINECNQITDNGGAEFRRLGWPDSDVMQSILNDRAIRWINLEILTKNKDVLPPDVKRRRRWVPRVQLAFVAAATAVVQLVAGGRANELADVYKELHEKRIKVKPPTPPPPKPRQPMIRRFLSSTKRAVLTGRWRER